MASKSSLSQTQKNTTRMHPYGAQQQQNIVTNNRKIGASSVATVSTKPNANATTMQRQMHMDTYDLQDYLIGDKNVKQLANDYPTMRRNQEPAIGIAYKGLLKNRTNLSAENKSASNKKGDGGKQSSEETVVDIREMLQLKFLSGNTNSIEYFTRKFEHVNEMHKASQGTKVKNMPSMVGAHLFEIIGKYA